MSKPAKNIEKVLLGVAVIAAGAFGFLGFKKAGAVETDFADSIPGPGKNKDASVKGAQQVPATIASLTADRVFDTGMDEDRAVDVFVGVPLFARRESPNDPVDLVKDAPVHKGIDNVWWLKHHVSPNFADSPLRDADGDGFSNQEEHDAGTHPDDPKEHPSLLAKLSYINDESLNWIVLYNFFSGEKWIPKYEEYKDGKKLTNRTDFEKGLAPGDLFFAEAPMAKRFKFIGVEDREVENKRTNTKQKMKFAIYEDQKPNKKGRKYEIPDYLPNAEKSANSHWDRTAVLDLQALGLAGQEFKVEENTTFALPPTATEKAYKITSVTPEAIEVEYGPENDRKTVSIPKGGLPDLPSEK